jgi:hypothetical protein
MEIWVAESFYSGDYSTNVELFESEDCALLDAVNAAISTMEDEGCDSNESVYNKSYTSICNLKKSGKYRDALSTYNKWADSTETNIFLSVYSKELHLKTDMDGKVNSAFLPKKEVPCKCCGTNLNEGETPCWKCGSDDPTKGS